MRLVSATYRQYNHAVKLASNQSYFSEYPYVQRPNCFTFILFLVSDIMEVSRQNFDLPVGLLVT